MISRDYSNLLLGHALLRTRVISIVLLFLLLAILDPSVWMGEVKSESSNVLFDDFSSDTGIWEYVGSAYRDTTESYVVLTQPVGFQAGVIFLNSTFKSCLTANFRYKVG